LETFIFLIIIIEIKDETEKASYIQLLIDLQLLPFCLSKNFVERILNNNKYLKDFDYLQTLLKSKEEWSSAYRKNSFILRARTTQRVERTNRLIKSCLSSRSTLNELLIRLIELQQSIVNHILFKMN